MNDPDERKLRDAMNTQAAIDRAEAMGTPQGLRLLFPTNHIRMHVSDVRKMKLNPLQRKALAMATKKPQTDATRTDTPTASPGDAQRAEQASAGTRQGMNREDAGDPAYAPVLPRGPIPSPGEIERQEQGDNGTPADLGPDPERPKYTGTLRTHSIDMLEMAAAAEDEDAIRGVRTLGEPPEVAQYKANLLDWLSRVQTLRASREAQRNADAGTDPDSDSSGNGAEEA